MTKRIYFGFNEWDASDFEAACFQESLEEVKRRLAVVDWSVEKTAPLHAAILGRRDDETRHNLVSLLVAAKSPVDALAFAHAARFQPMLLTLLPDPTVTTSKTSEHLRSALVALVERRRPADIPRLLNLGAAPNAPDAQGWTALHHVCRHADLPTLRALRSGKEKLDGHKCTDVGQTPLMVLEASPMYNANQADGAAILAELQDILRA